MKTLVIFYSLSGRTKSIANNLAAEKSCDIAEIMDIKRPGKLKAFTAGIHSSIKGKSWPIKSLNLNLLDYDHLILLSPVWADNPPPAVNSALELIPAGKTIDIKMVSNSGKSNCKDRLEALITAKGSVLESFEDIKK